MASSDPAESFVPGARCCCDGSYATIRFVGEVPPAKGVWGGVEWDESSRGKHSGSHEGVEYFACSKPGSGSFVRPKKLTLGYTFIEALRMRYASAAREPCESGGGGGVQEEKEEEMFVISRDSLITPVEMVGADKINKKTRQLDNLGSVSTSVRGMLISSAGPAGEVSTVAPNIRELDVSSNLLLSSWQTVADVCSQLPQLRTLNVSENLFLSLPDNPCTLTPAFQHVTELSINKMQLTWPQVCRTVSMFPGLERLFCCENIISNITSQLPLHNLRLLTMEMNQLSSWEEVSSLASLPRLETLILNDNKIPAISSGETNTYGAGSDGRSQIFAHLKSLSISRNCIHSWSSILSLAPMPALRELKVKGNPLFAGDSDLNSRQLVIAQLPLLQGLNGSPVTDRERVVAERYYLTKYSSMWVESQSGGEEEKRRFEQAHPRFTVLAEIHNIPLVPSKPAGSSVLKNSLLSITVCCPDHPESKQLSKRLPGNMTVQKLKGLLQRAYGVDWSDQRLTYLDQERQVEIEVNDDLKQLSYYSIQSGDTILLRW